MVTMNLSNTENSTNAPEGTGLMEKLKFLEEEREKSFKYWQYGINDNCSIKKMAEAGFYYSGLTDEDDSATCFVCGKILDGWEKNDDPWSEHEKHAPNCYFVKLHCSQEDLTVKELLDLAAFVLKAYVTAHFHRKMQALKKQIEETTTMIKQQQF